MPIFGMNKELGKSKPQIITGEYLKEQLVISHWMSLLPIYTVSPAYPIYSGARVSDIEEHLKDWVHEKSLVNKSFLGTNLNELCLIPTVRPRINRCIENRSPYRSIRKEFSC